MKLINISKVLLKQTMERKNYNRENININLLAYTKNCHFKGNNYVDRFCRLRNVTLGKYSYIGYDSDFNNVQIGNYCSISSNVKIGLGKHPINFVSTSPVFYSSKNPFKKNINKIHFDDNPDITHIGNDVWIGTNVILMDGITIGDGAVIAAGSIVTKDVKAYDIVAGIPAQKIKQRFDDDIIQNLILDKWWEKDPEELMNFLPYFNSSKEYLEKVMIK